MRYQTRMPEYQWLTLVSSPVPNVDRLSTFRTSALSSAIHAFARSTSAAAFFVHVPLDEVALHNLPLKVLEGNFHR